MRTFLIVLAVLVVVVLGVGAYVLVSPDAQNLFRSTTPADGDLMQELVGFVGAPYLDDYDTTRVTGYVDNFSSEELASVTVEVQLLNESGEREELVTFDVEDISPGNRKTFDVSAGTLPGPRTAEIALVSAEVYE